MKLLRAFVLACAFLMPIASQAQTDLGGFDIRNFVSDITVGKDAVVHVREEIEIRFYEQRHGIFRNIPVEYENDKGNTVSIVFSVNSVLANNVDVPYTVNRDGRDVVVKIGDADKYVNGTVKYAIDYSVERVLLHSDAGDELYWNVTGDGWPVVPRKVAATVRLPSGAKPEQVEMNCYTGSYGSQMSACTKTAELVDDVPTASFAANDFLTVAVRVPAGLIERPTALDRLWWFLSDNKIMGLPLLLFLVLFAYWWREGRDPKPRAIVAEFSAPEGMTPAEVGVLHDGKVHDRELSATIVDLAVRGYLKIIEKEEKGVFGTSRSFTIERTDKPLEGLKKHEELLLEAVMGSAQRRELSDMSSRAKEVKANRDEAEHVLYEDMAARKWFVKNPQTVRNWFLGAAVAIAIGAVWIVSGFSTAWMFSLLVCAGIIAIFGFIMPKRTEAGTRVYEQVLGFQEYLSKAEKYRLQWQEKEHVFEKFLPYAMVFMVVDKWTNSLASVIKSPDWYQGAHPGVWDVYLFNSAMGDLNRSLNSAVMVAPKSAASGGSGIGGGGFSGGGFGGGGGGSW